MSSADKPIVTNLLSNAVKFTERGELRLSANLLPSDTEDKAILKIVVSDTGIGIPESKLSHLFEAFTQVDASTTRRYGGTGLGLSITKKLCQLLGGDIRVSTQLGKGSSFEVTMSVGYMKEHVEVPPKVNERKACCLIIDNNASVRTAMQKQLERWGVEVLLASSVEEAFSILAISESAKDKGEHLVNIVFLDKKSEGTSIENFCEKLSS